MSHATEPRSFVDCVHASRPTIAPSLLAANFAALGDEIRRLEQAGAKVLHLDVMDGHFVPNLSFGFPILEAVRAATDLPLDVHLMITNPSDYLERYCRAGADAVTFHIEAVEDPRPMLDTIRRHGAAAGLTLNPPTPIESVAPYLADCDLLLVMSVMAGFGGQSFDDAVPEKLATLRRAAPKSLVISVDGGVNEDTIGRCAEVGVDEFVVGTGLLAAEDYTARLSALRGLAVDGRRRGGFDVST